MSTQMSTEAMEKTAGDCEALGEDLGAKMQSIMVALEPMDKDLQGKAGTTFMNVKQTIRTEVTNINRLLDDIAKAIRTSGRKTDASDDESDQALRTATADVEGSTASNQLMSGK